MMLSTSIAAQPGSDLLQGLQSVSQRRIFFGHQSVGGNVLDGLRDLASESRIPVKIVQGSTLEGPGVLHEYVGENEKPLSKVRAFEMLMNGGLGSQVEIAFFKFCYIDFTPETDVVALFNEYRRTLDALK